MRCEILRNRIKIMHQPESQNSYGEEVSDITQWTEYAEVYASIEPIQGREFFSAQQVNSIVDTRIRIRYLFGVKPNMKVLFDSRIYEIKAVIDVNERHKEMQLMCQEVSNG